VPGPESNWRHRDFQSAGAIRLSWSLSVFFGFVDRPSDRFLPLGLVSCAEFQVSFKW